MAYKVIILYRLYMPSYVLGTFTEYPDSAFKVNDRAVLYIVKSKIRLKVYFLKLRFSFYSVFFISSYLRAYVLFHPE